MKTQISVLVKGETLMGKLNSNRFLGPFALLTKSKVIMVLDGKKHELAKSKQPYIFDVEPGQHQIQFTDPKKGNKEFAKSIDKVTAGAIGFAIGAGSGNTVAGSVLAEDFASLVPGRKIEGGVANIILNEGDILKLSCQGNSSGVPNVKVLKK